MPQWRQFSDLTNSAPNPIEACSDRMRVAREHRLNSVSGNPSKVGVVDPGRPQARDIAVAALVRANVET